MKKQKDRSKQTHKQIKRKKRQIQNNLLFMNFKNKLIIIKIIIKNNPQIKKKKKKKIILSINQSTNYFIHTSQLLPILQYQFIMGNNSISNQFMSGNWTTIQSIGNRQILQNILTHTQLQKHLAYSNFTSFDDRFKNTQLYNWRKSLPQTIPIIKLYDYQIKQQRFGIQQDQYVYTQIIHRLNHKAIIFSKPQAFLLILDLLTGLDILFQTFGIFNIDIFLLGLSNTGRGKVWLNQNYAKNTIDQTNQIQIHTENNQLIVLNNLVRLIKDKVYNQTFMPQIQFPSNMYLKNAIQYLKEVRRDHPLFRVDKVYLDRNQFRDYYDNIYKQNSVSIQQSTQINQNFHRTANNLVNPQLQPISQHFPNSLEPNKMQRQKSVSAIKIKNQPSETLSSDSNSRSKKPSDISLQTADYPKEDHQQIHHGKIHLKGIIQKQRVTAPISRPVNDGPHFLNTQFNNSGNNFFSNQQAQRQPVFQQIQMIPNTHQNSIQQILHKPQMNKQVVQQNRAPQFNQRPIMPINQVNHAPELLRGGPPQQMIQRKIVEYRPLNVEQRQNIQQITGPAINNKQRFMPVHNMPVQNMPVPPNPHQPVQQIFRQTIHPSSQTPPLGMQNRPLQPEAFHSLKMGLNNVMTMNMNIPLLENDQFINDVELCESVIFDRKEIEQNMADL